MNKYISILGFLILTTSYFACIDQDFDTPPGFTPQTEDISNMTIADLKQMHNVGQLSSAIPDGTIIKGTVVSDDATGNFFKDLVIQDGTAGIHIRIDQSDLNTIYPRGREVFVNCDGLYVGDFGGLTQIGTEGSDENNPSNVNRIPQVLVPEKIIIGALNEVPIGTAKTIDELSSADLSTLISLQGVEIRDDELGATYAIPNGGSTQNRHVVDCDGDEIVLRNSDFADFAGAVMPGGNGTLTGVYSIFGSTLQFTIRDTDDVNMNEDRCDGSGGNTGGEIQEEDISNMSISDLLALHSIGANAAAIPEGTIIRGSVISDDTADNFFKVLVLQDATAGVQIRIDKTDLNIDYPRGRIVYVDCSGLYIGDFNGLPQMGTQDEGSNVGRISQISSVLIKGPVEDVIEATPRSINTISSSDLNTLISINNLEFVQDELGNTYADAANMFSENRIMQDCSSNQLILRSSGFADFAGTLLPEGNGMITGIYAVFGTDMQMNIRDLNDVNMSGDRCDGSGGGPSINEGFESQSDFDPINLAGWVNVSTTGEELWEKSSFSGNGFAQATAFQSADTDVDAWLVTPELDLAMVSSLEFESAHLLYSHDGLSVLFSNDFTGDVSTATWEVLDCTIAGSGDNENEWVDSGIVDLTQLSGATGYIAFRYEGDSAVNNTAFRLDNVNIQ